MKKLIEQRAFLVSLLNSMLDTVKSENRAFNDEETKKFNETEAQIKALDATIQAEERAKNISKFHAPEPTPQAAQLTQQQIEERAFTDFLNGKVTEMRSGEQNVTMANNAAVIPESIANRIIDEIVDICPILAGAEVYHEKGKLSIPKWTKANSTHDITVGYATEFQELTADSGKFTSVDLGGFLAGALVLIGKSVINNAAVNVAGFTIKKIAEKAAQFIEHELLAGVGSTTAAEGALNTTNIVTSGTALTIDFDDLVKLQSKIKQAYQKKACWTMNNTTFTAIKLLKDKNGRPLIEQDASKEFPYVLLGKPINISDSMPDIGANALPILYGDYSGLSVNFREDIGIEVLKEVYHTQHAIGIDCWFEFDSRITDEQKLAVLKVKAS